MAVPDLKKAEFPMKLHKKKGFKDPATIDGTGIAAGNKVKAVGTQGNKPTVWEGTIKQKNPDGTWAVDNLAVKFEEKRGKDPEKGTEDVSVTVTNADGESQPVIAKDVPVIP